MEELKSVITFEPSTEKEFDSFELACKKYFDFFGEEPLEVKNEQQSDDS